MDEFKELIAALQAERLGEAILKERHFDSLELLVASIAAAPGNRARPEDVVKLARVAWNGGVKDRGLDAEPWGRTVERLLNGEDMFIEWDYEHGPEGGEPIIEWAPREQLGEVLSDLAHQLEGVVGSWPEVIDEIRSVVDALADHEHESGDDPV